MTDTETWNRLLMFESPDLVKRHYKTRHGGKLNSSKAAEITAHFTQGREYFRSSSISSNYVRPLLQYYGVLAMTRGLILFLEIRIREAGLKPSHGITSVDWNETLAVQGNLFNLEVKFDTNGTLPHLTRLTNNQQDPIDMAETKINLDDLISRIPEFDDLYREIFSKHPNCFDAILMRTAVTGEADLIVFPSKLGLPEESSIRNVSGVGAEAEMRIGDFAFGTYNPGPVIHFTQLHGKPLPNLEPHKDKGAVIISAFNGGGNLGPLPRLFVLSYFMGMLVRYNPTQWLSIVNRQSNSIAFPILQAAYRLVDVSFPARILAELEASDSD